MELSAYLAILWRHKQVIALTTVVTVLVTLIVTFLTPPSYVASTTLHVTTPASRLVEYVNYDTLMYSGRLLNTYSKIATSAPVLERLAQRLGVPDPPLVKVELPANTELMEIIVESHDPRLAAEGANQLAEILIVQARELSVGSGKTAQDLLRERLTQLGGEIEEARRADRTSTLGAGPDAAAGARGSIELQEESYRRLLEQFERARLLDEIRANTISVIEPAAIPEAPAKPHTLLNAAFALVIGAVAGSGLGFLFENLGIRPHMTARNGHQLVSSIQRAMPGAGRFFRNALTDISPLQPVARSDTQAQPVTSRGDGLLQKVLVVHGQRGESKPRIMADLGITLARSGWRVVVIDGNLRLPTLHQVFGLRNEAGLSSLLKQEITLDEALQDIHVHGIRVLTSGPWRADTPQLITSERMSALLQELVQRFDVVLIDSSCGTAVVETISPYRGTNGIALRSS